MIWFQLHWQILSILNYSYNSNIERRSSKVLKFKFQKNLVINGSMANKPYDMIGTL